MTLSDAEVVRYSRQLALAGWDGTGQERLAAAGAIVVGAGALGSPAATYIAAAGVGRIGIVDSEPVELADLNRQPLHLTPDIGSNKAESAAVKLGVLNPELRPEPYPVRLEEVNAEAIVTGADVVLDCSNSPATAALVNAACCSVRVPLVEGSVRGLRGTVMSIRPGESACLRCGPPPTESGTDPERGALGALGAIGGLIGSIQALEALKLLTGLGEPLVDRVLELEGRDMSQRLVNRSRRPDCPACAGAGAPQQSA